MKFYLQNTSIRVKFVVMAVSISLISVLASMMILGFSNVKQNKSNLELLATSDARRIGNVYRNYITTVDLPNIDSLLQSTYTKLSYVTIAISDTSENILGFISELEQPVINTTKSADEEFLTYDGTMVLNYPIYHHNNLLGHINLQLNTQFHNILKGLIVPIIVVVLASVLIALLIAMRFRKFITHPILNLARAVSKVSSQKDYSVQLTKRSNDEIGVLYDNFNYLLKTIRQHEEERDAAERAYQISEENFLNIFHNSYDGILLTDMEGGFLEVNETLCNYIGYSREQFTKRGILSFVTPEYMDRRDVIMHDLRFKGYSSHDITLIASNGEHVPFEVNSRLIFYEDQHGILSILRDVRERKQAQEKILHEANVNRAMAQISREILNPDLSLENISHTVDLLAQKLTKSKLGYTAYFDPDTLEKVVSSTDKNIDWDNSGHSIVRFPKTDEGYACLYQIVTDERKAYYNNSPKPNNRSPGRGVSNTKILNYLSVPAISGDKTVGQIVVANTGDAYDEQDLAIISRIAGIYSVAVHQKLTNEELKKEIRRAEESDKLKSAFLANMSHEIRTPMNGILGFANLLRKEDLSQNARERYLNIISGSSERLLTILNDIIDISKIESGVISITNSRFSLNLLLDEVYTFFIPAASKKSIELKLERRSGSDIIFNTDRQKVSQILTNLVSNAIKFTLKGGVEIKYSVNQKTQIVAVQIKDSGIGIEPKYKNKIFQRFRQVETSITRQFGGNGLGLSISKAFAEAMNGNLSFESEVNKGTTFTLELKYHEYGKELVEDPKLKEELERVNFNGKCILIVEDDEYNYEYLHNLLESIGIKLLWAKDGVEGVNKIKELHEEINLVLMDIKLPVMDGYDATKNIKELQPNIPVIAQTAYGLSEDKHKAISSNCDDYLSKPLKPAQLIQLLKKYLK